MKACHFSVVCAAALVACPAGAANDWKTASLGNGVTIDVPAVVGDDYLPSKDVAAKGALMFFSVSAEADDLICALQREQYSKKLSAGGAAVLLATSQREAFCAMGDGNSNVAMRGSKASTSNGYPAGLCAASYTHAGEANPGRMDAVLSVAAPDALYVLKCTVSSPSQRDAEQGWDLQYGNDFKHMGDSLHLSRK